MTDDLLIRFNKFKKSHSKNWHLEISSFLDEEKDLFYKAKVSQYVKDGITRDDAMIKTRQAWVTTVGNILEKLIVKFLSDFCKEYNLKIIKDSQLKSNNLSKELDYVRRLISVNFGIYSILPDSDLVIYSGNDENVEIKAILSVKNSFRERYSQTPYWKLKLLQSEITKHIKVFMITPDKDDEVSFINSSRGLRKARIVMEYELDGIYLAKDEFNKSDKVKSLDYLFVKPPIIGPPLELGFCKVFF